MTEALARTPIEISLHGTVDDATIDYARHRLITTLDQVSEPILFARLKLTLEPDPARERPALAQVSVDINGDVVRAHVAARELREAADILQRRLSDKLEHRAARQRERHRDDGRPEPGEWRHGDLSPDRPDYFDRPRGDRRLVRRKTFALEELTLDEAAFDMDQLDADFYLFRDLATGDDAVLGRQLGGTYLLTRLHPVAVDPGPTAIQVAVDQHVPPTTTVADAISLLDEGGLRYVFFAEATTGRGNVVYRRYDGHYGLVTPA